MRSENEVKAKISEIEELIETHEDGTIEIRALSDKFIELLAQRSINTLNWVLGKQAGLGDADEIKKII